VRARRKARGLTQADLAVAAGVGRRFVVELEQGKPSIAFDKALRVAAQLGLVLSAKPRDNISEDSAERLTYPPIHELDSAISGMTEDLLQKEIEEVYKITGLQPTLESFKRDQQEKLKEALESLKTALGFRNVSKFHLPSMKNLDGDETQTTLQDHKGRKS